MGDFPQVGDTLVTSGGEYKIMRVKSDTVSIELSEVILLNYNISDLDWDESCSSWVIHDPDGMLRGHYDF